MVDADDDEARAALVDARRAALDGTHELHGRPYANRRAVGAQGQLLVGDRDGLPRSRCACVLLREVVL
eukprot:2752777-Prymnesium_polylepis.1